jgi:GntR family transcriptional regulator
MRLSVLIDLVARVVGWLIPRGGVMVAQPMYQQIAEDLRQQIESGQLPPGGQLPTELELRDTYNASRNTIRDAIRRLISQGLVETRPGQGTFVTRKIDPFVTILSSVRGPQTVESPADPESAAYLSEVHKSHRKASASVPEIWIQDPSAEVARRLGVTSSTQVVCRQQRRYIDGIPWSLQTSFYPMDFTTKGATRLLMAADITEGAVRYLADTIGVKQVGYRDWITARVPDATEQDFFGISHDASVFEVFRTGFDEDGRPMRVTVTVHPTDRNQLIVNIGDVPGPE